jgi:hypothetical protein
VAGDRYGDAAVVRAVSLALRVEGLSGIAGRSLWFTAIQRLLEIMK